LPVRDDRLKFAAIMPPDTTPLPLDQVSTLQARTIGAINWRGLWTLSWRESRRFLKVFTQTIVAPVMTAILLLAVFALALGGSVRQVGGVSFAEFLASGLIIMAMAQNAFANTSSSMSIAKMQGTIVDTLMAPLSPIELTIGIAAGGVMRGLCVGAATAAVLIPFVSLHFHNVAFILFHGVAASMLLALIGLAGGIWAQKLDHLAAVTNFIVMPAAFLSGTFYTIDRLPEPWHQIALFNPFFYMIDGFRYGFIGHADSNLTLGIVIMLACNAAMFALCHWMLRTGYKLRA
jgi:ABC-2 type transport system permease protein